MKTDKQLYKVTCVCNSNLFLGRNFDCQVFDTFEEAFEYGRVYFVSGFRTFKDLTSTNIGGDYPFFTIKFRDKEWTFNIFDFSNLNVFVLEDGIL